MDGSITVVKRWFILDIARPSKDSQLIKAMRYILMVFYVIEIAILLKDISSQWTLFFLLIQQSNFRAIDINFTFAQWKKISIEFW